VGTSGNQRNDCISLYGHLADIPIMKKLSLFKAPLILVLGAALTIATGVPSAHAGSSASVHRFNPQRDKLVMVKDGRIVQRPVDPRSRVVLRHLDGSGTRADINQLVAGAKVLKVVDRNGDGDLDKIVLRERSSGNSDCSFDVEDDAAAGPWSCRVDHDSPEDDELQDCSFDISEEESEEAGEGERSREISWDCSYEQESEDGDGLSWDCSFDASEEASWDPVGGSADGDTSFDCSWESSEPLPAPLFACSVVRNPLGWSCRSTHLQQYFGVNLAMDGTGFEAFMDFNRDYIDTDHGTGSTCTSVGGGVYDCAFDLDEDAGTCSIDLSFERHVEEGFVEGDVSGDMSYSCESESESESESDD
jgi:hypothetical protein